PLTVHCERPAGDASTAAQPAPAAEPSASGGVGSSLLAQIPTGNLLSTPSSPAATPQGTDWALVLTSGGKRRVLGGNVAPNGLHIELDGQLVTLQLELERAMPGVSPVRVWVTRKIRLAN